MANNITKRIITWQAAGATFSRGFIFGNLGCSAADYAKLVKQARKDFPHLKLENIELGKVLKSSYMKGFALVSFPLPAHTEREGYDQRSTCDFSY